MPAAKLKIQSSIANQAPKRTVTTTLTNTSNHIAFFVRVEVTHGPNGDEVLPITYDDNYVTVFPHESRRVTATMQPSALGGTPLGIRVDAYKATGKIEALRQSITQQF
jgi:exo-1,4-beta-D-glucosaminidase